MTTPNCHPLFQPPAPEVKPYPTYLSDILELSHEEGAIQRPDNSFYALHAVLGKQEGRTVQLLRIQRGAVDPTYHSVTRVSVLFNSLQPDDRECTRDMRPGNGLEEMIGQVIPCHYELHAIGMDSPLLITPPAIHEHERRIRDQLEAYRHQRIN